MKKIAVTLVLIFTVSIGYSQERRMMNKRTQMTPEQQATIMAKKLALQLDLNKDQTRKITSLYTNMAKDRKAKGMKMRKEATAEREKLMKIKKSSKNNADFKMKVEKAVKEGKIKKESLRRGKTRRQIDYASANKALDNRLDFQNKMKRILTPEQYQKFKKLQKNRVAKVNKHQKGMKKRKMQKKGKMQKRSKRQR